jgi:hypothetical protein
VLHAIIGNKSGRVEIKGEKIRVRDIYRDSEDMLTATIVSRIGYLSDSVLNALFRMVFSESERDFSQLCDIEFWPNFRSTIQDRVEPDVIMRFEWGTLLIEAKRPHDGFQYAQQWLNELESLPRSYLHGDLYFLALGGSKRNNLEEIQSLSNMLGSDKYKAVPTPNIAEYLTWEKLANCLQELKDEQICSRGDDRILSDLIAALELYNVTSLRFDLSTLRSCGVSSLSIDALHQWGTTGIPEPEELLRENEADMKLSQLVEQNFHWSQSIKILGR